MRPDGRKIHNQTRKITYMASLADDIAKLRSEGIHDDEILSNYKEYDPRHNEGIDKLLSEGMSSKDILDGLGPFVDAGNQASPDPQASEGVLEKSAKALQYGAATAATGLGRTADWVGRMSGLDAARRAGAVLEDAGKAIAPANYRPASGQFMDPSDKDKGVGGFGWSYLPRAILEGAPGLAMDLGAGALTGGTGFLASNAARGFGPTMDARTINNGGKDATPGDYAAALGSTALQAYLSKVGINPAVSSVAKGAGLGAIAQIPGQVAKAGAVDAVSGAAGNIVQQAGDSVGTDKGLTINPQEALGSGVLSGATAAGLRGVRGAGDVNNAAKFWDMDPQAAGRLAERIKSSGFSTDDPKASYRAYKVADGLLNAATSRLEPHALKDADASVRESVEGIKAALDNGYHINLDGFDTIRERLGGSEHGKAYVEALEERNALNTVKSKSYVDDVSGLLGGGITSSPVFKDFVSPASWITNPTQRTLGAIGAGLGLGSNALAMAHAATAGKVLAAQGAAAIGARAVDGLMGNRNPLGEMVRRFDGLAEAPARPSGESTGNNRDRAAREGLTAVSQALSDSADRVASPAGAGKAILPPDGAAAPAGDRASDAALSAVERALAAPMGERSSGRASRAALSAIEQALNSPEASPVSQAPSGVAGKPMEAPQAPSGYMGSSEGSEAAGGASKSSGESVESAPIKIRHGKYEVARPREGIKNVKAYVTATKDRMAARANMADELEAIAPKHAREIEGMVNKLNTQAKTSEEAYSIVEDLIDRLPWDLKAQAFDVYTKHEPKVSATYPR